MMKKTILSVFVILLLGLNLAQAQETTFKPSGKVTARGFLNANSSLNHGNGVALDIKRAYLGYQYKLTPHLQAKVVGDFAAGKSADGKLVPALKNAFLQWSHKGLTIKGGMIGLYQFKAQESYWGHRYIYKSFQDQNKFGHSADVGFSVKYQFAKPFSADFSITNGEGYKKIQRNKSMRYQLGVSIAPAKHWLVRLYADIYNNSRDMHEEGLPSYDIFENQYTYTAFVGYKNHWGTAGIEYNQQMNAQLIKDRTLSGYSAYVTINLNKQWHTFVRFDCLESSKEEGEIWNRRDGKTALIGAQYQVHKSIKIAPNVRYNYNEKNKSDNYEVYLNVEFKI